MSPAPEAKKIAAEFVSTFKPATGTVESVGTHASAVSSAPTAPACVQQVEPCATNNASTRTPIATTVALVEPSAARVNFA